MKGQAYDSTGLYVTVEIHRGPTCSKSVTRCLVASYREEQYFALHLVQASIDKAHCCAGWLTDVDQQQRCAVGTHTCSNTWCIITMMLP